MNTLRRNKISDSSNNDRWDPSKGDFISEASAEEVKNLNNKIRRDTVLVFLLSFTTISIFLAAVYYFSLSQL